MVRPQGMTAAVENRVMLAIDRMLTLDEGIYQAARAAGTTRASIFKWLTANNISWSRSGKSGKIIIEPPMSARVNAFLSNMAEGKSASQSAKEAGTTVRTMSRQTLDDGSGTQVNIISKVGNRWESNFLTLFRHNLVVYGKLIGLDNKLQGKPGATAGPLRRGAKGRADPNYADIWWQFDLDGFYSTFNAVETAQFYKPMLVAFLKGRLENFDIKDVLLGTKFMQNSKVAYHAALNNRLDTAMNLVNVSQLEQLLQRYDLRLAEKINIGVDSNRLDPQSTTPEFISKTATLVQNPITVNGVFQTFFLTQNDLKIFPPKGMKIPFTYSLI